MYKYTTDEGNWCHVAKREIIGCLKLKNVHLYEVNFLVGIINGHGT
jgi:hypothetical protein